MKGGRPFYILFLLVITVSTAFGQQKSKTQLQNERTSNLKKIKEAEQTLEQTSSKKKSSVGQLNALKYQISTRQKVITGIKEEIALLNKEINDNQEIITALEDDLKGLKQEYTSMIYAAYKASNGRDKLTFLFSSKSFNQLFRRLKYMEQYGEARKKQVEQILAVQVILIDENKAVAEKKVDKSILLTDQLSESSALVKLKSKEQTVLTSLQKEEKKLKRELAKRVESLIALDKLINELIKREAEEAVRVAALAKSNASTNLSEDFSKNKLKLPWPAVGFVSQKFGRSRDPVLKMIERNSPGIEIQTNPSSDARSIFDGKVAAVVLIQGFNKAVLIKHGDYFSVYAKLDEVYVKKGQELNVGDKVGKIFTGSDGIAELHFELWQSKENGTTKLNPEQWLVKK